MSLEQKIDNLVNVIEKLVTVIEARQAISSGVAQPQSLAAKLSAKLSAKPEDAPIAPVAQVAPPGSIAAEAQWLVEPKVIGETLVGTPSMPPLPTFVAPVEPPKPGAPFSDPKGMIQYVTESYKALGPVKGAKIQDIITALGHHNINDIRPDQYASLYASVEALK